MAVVTKPWAVGKTEAPLPPKVKSLPLLGIALNLRHDPLQYFVQKYHEYGPIFRVNVVNRPITVMAGLDANHFLNTDGNHLLTSEILFGGFARELETDVFLVAMEGEPHQHLRKVMRSGYSRSAISPYVDTLNHIVDEYTATLHPGDRIQVFPTMQRLVTEQLGLVMADRSPDTYFPHIQRFMRYILNVKVIKLWHPIMLKSPAYQRSKARVMELAQEVLATHRTQHGIEGKHNLIDDMLVAHDHTGQPYSEDALLAAIVGPYLAGMDTVASSLSFFFYTVLKHPEVMHAIIEEADTLFQQSTLDINQFKDLETLHGATMETLRMYPVAPFTPRHAREEFEFAGHRIEADTEIFFAQTITHYLPEFYPDPYTFNPSRFAKGQGKGTPGAFAPFTLGAHLCLGAGIAEAQMMLVLARFLHNLRLELESPDYVVPIHATPLPNPGRDFYVRVIKNRQNQR